MRFRTSSISYISSAVLSISGPVKTYSVLKTLFRIIVLIRKEGTDPYPGPTEDRDNKRNLDFISKIGKMIIVNGPESSSNLDQLLSADQMLRLLFIYDQTFFGQGIPYLLIYFRSAGDVNFGLGCIYATYCPFIFFFDAVASYPSESSEKPLRKGIYKVRGDEFGLAVDNPIANKGDKPKEVFDSCKIEKSKPFPKTLRSYSMRNIDRTLPIGMYLVCLIYAFLDKS